MSTVLANTISAVGGGGSTLKMANDATYVSDGGGVTQNTVQGLCKVWIELRTVDGGPVSGDSFNVSSLDDDATGRFTVHPSNNMSGVYNSKAGMPYSTTGTANMIQVVGYDDQSASQFQLTSVDEANSASDMTSLGFTVHGDLA